MKKIYKTLILLFIVAFLAGCTASADVIEGKDNVELGNIDGNIENIEIDIPLEPIVVPVYDFRVQKGYEFSYDSISELSEALKGLDFRPDFIEKLHAANAISYDSNNVSVLSNNLSNLYVGAFPQGVTTMDYTWFNVKSIGQRFTESDTIGGGRFIWSHNDTYNELEFPKSEEEAFSLFMDTSDSSLVESTKYGVSTKEYTTVNPYSTCKMIIYTLVEGNKTLFVCEQYITYSADPYIKASEYPVNVKIYGIENNKYFNVIVSDLKIDVTKDWLLEFGVQKYQNDVVTE